VKLWDVAWEKEKSTLRGHAGAVKCLAFCPDGKTLASGGVDNTVKLWDVVSGDERVSLKGHPNSVRSVAFAPDKNTLASCCDECVRLWRAATEQEVLSRDK
jgi:WD40 repeat protein